MGIIIMKIEIHLLNDWAYCGHGEEKAQVEAVGPWSRKVMEFGTYVLCVCVLMYGQ